ncbi:MAG: CBS domain-containing protein [Betaproteobacteria bacterium]
MQLKEILTQPVETVAPEASLFDAARCMMTRDLGWLPVSDDGKVVGIITDRDIAIRGVAAGLDPKQTKVDAVMSRAVFACSVDGTVEEACQMMEDEQVRRLVVLDENEALAGVVSLADLALHTRGSQSSEVLQKVSEPT